MIKLLELLHSVKQEEKEGLIAVDNWRWPDVDHLINMGFEFGDDFHLNTAKDPKITIYRKKELENGSTGKKQEYFYVEEDGRKKKRFKSFNDVIDFFDHYEQPELDKNT